MSDLRLKIYVKFLSKLTLGEIGPNRDEMVHRGNVGCFRESVFWNQAHLNTDNSLEMGDKFSRWLGLAAVVIKGGEGGVFESSTAESIDKCGKEKLYRLLRVQTKVMILWISQKNGISPPWTYFNDSTVMLSECVHI